MRFNSPLCISSEIPHTRKMYSVFLTRPFQTWVVRSFHSGSVKPSSTESHTPIAYTHFPEIQYRDCHFKHFTRLEYCEHTHCVGFSVRQHNFTDLIIALFLKDFHLQDVLIQYIMYCVCKTSHEQRLYKKKTLHYKKHYYYLLQRHSKR